MKRPRTTRRRPRRRVRRRMAAPRRSPSAGIVSVKRTMIESFYTLTNAWAGAQWTFRLDKLPDYTEFNALFGEYRIMAVKMMFIPLLDNIEATAQLAATNYITTPRLYGFVDKDGQPPYTSENAVLQHSKLKIIRSPLKPFSIYCPRPGVSEGLQTTASVAYSGVKTGQWISCDSPSVNHYGIVTGGVIPFTGGSKALSYNVIVTYYMQFKGRQ